MAPLNLISVIDEGLGNSTYLLGLGGGEALVVDPERDLRMVRRAAKQHGLRIAFAVETHLHADFISGVRELAEAEGAVVLAPQVGAREFAYRGLTDGDTMTLGGVTLKALATPGHSPEHLSYLVLQNGEIAGVFTGGSLMVGTAGRTDLVSPEMTVPLARAQFRSLQRLMELPDETPVWPTHGSGSFCSAGAGGDRVTTIGRERATNPLLQVSAEDEFVDALLGTLGSFPDYFLRLGEVNRQGPAVLKAAPKLAPLSAEQISGFVAQGAQIVDTRTAEDYAAGHIPGSLSIALRPAFATWLGWLADPERPLAIVRGPEQDPDEIAWAAAKVGLDTLVGELKDGMIGWNREATATLVLAPATDLVAGAPPTASLLDIRQDSEFAAGHFPGAVNIELGTLASRLPNVPAEGPVVVMCGHGERAMTAASILERAGRTDLTVLSGGPGDWAKATGRELETRVPEDIQP